VLKFLLTLIIVLNTSLAWSYCNTNQCYSNCTQSSDPYNCECFEGYEDIYEVRVPLGSSCPAGPLAPAACSGQHNEWYASGWFIAFDCCWNGEYEYITSHQGDIDIQCIYGRLPIAPPSGGCSGSCDEYHEFDQSCACVCPPESIINCDLIDFCEYNYETCTSECTRPAINDLYDNPSCEMANVQMRYVDNDLCSGDGCEFAQEGCVYKYIQSGGGGEIGLLDFLRPLEAWAMDCPDFGERYQYKGKFTGTGDYNDWGSGDIGIYYDKIWVDCEHYITDHWVWLQVAPECLVGCGVSLDTTWLDNLNTALSSRLPFSIVYKASDILDSLQNVQPGDLTLEFPWGIGEVNLTTADVEWSRNFAWIMGVLGVGQFFIRKVM